MSNVDAISQLQYEYMQLCRQAFSTYSWNSQRHPLVAPQERPGLPFTTPKLVAPNGIGTEDKDTPYPLDPQDPEVFAQGQAELAEDIVLKTKQIKHLIATLPGLDKDESQQAADIAELTKKVEEMEKVRKAKRREMHQIVKQLEAVIGGMNQSIKET